MRSWLSVSADRARAMARRFGCAFGFALASASGVCAAASMPGETATSADIEQGLPLIQTFSPADFDSPATPVGSQVFAIVRTNDGALLAANNEGLLRLDGTGWRTWNPIRGTILALAARPGGRVFVGGVDDLGYFDRFADEFVSLRAWSAKIGQPFGEFWVVLAGDRYAHFVDRERAYRWDGRRLQLVYQAQGETRQGALLAGAAVILDPAVGLVQLETSPVRPIAGSELLVALHDCALATVAAQLATLCSDGVLRLWSADGLVRTIGLSADTSRQLGDAKPTALATLDRGGFAVATRQGGLFLLDRDGALQGRLAQSSGLDNVRIFAVLATGVDGLWLGRDHGLAMIEWPGQVSRYDNDLGLPRIPLGVGRLDGRMSVVTSAGVYRLEPGANGFARATPQALLGDVLFDVTPTADALFIPARDGLYALTAAGTKQLDPRLCYEAEFVDGAHPHLIVGGDHGAWIMQRDDAGHWQSMGDIPGIGSEIRRITVDGPDAVWLSSRSARQLFRVRWNDDASVGWNPKSAIVEDYSNAAGLPSEPITPLTLPDGIAFASVDGLYRFDPARRRFRLDPALNALLATDNGEVRAAQTLDAHRVIVVQHDRYRLLVHEDHGWREQTSPLGRIPRGATPRSIYRDPDGTLWITTSDAVYRHRPQWQDALPSLPPPRVELERGRGSEPIVGSVPLKLGMAPMQLAFRFSSRVFIGGEHVSYRSRLLPIETEWGPWSDRSVRELSYVHAGDWVLEVQARDIFDRVSDTTRIRLHLDRPWYQTGAALLAYVLLALIALLLVLRWRDRQLRARSRALEALVRERTQALEKASVTDQLTGLHNRHYFDIATRDLLAQGERTLVALIDLDHFKRINDSRGHDVGDRVLMAVAGRLLAAVPADAVLFRWGGEEFLLLAPLGEDDESAAIIARILHEVGDAPVAISDDAFLNATCSIGWEIAPLGDGASIREALRRADLDLYAAKQGGRDRAYGPDNAIQRRQ